MWHIYYKKERDKEVTILEKPVPGCWIHIDEATSSDLLELTNLTGIESADLQDCVDKYEIPRIEKVNHHVLIFTRYPTDQEIGLYTSTFTIILSDQFFITISPVHSALVTSFIEQKRHFTTIDHNKLLTMILLKTNQEFTSQIRRVRYNVLSAEKEMIHVASEDITGLTKNEEILNQYLSSLAPIRSVLEGISSGRFTDLYEKDRDTLEDLLNAMKQSEELCTIVLKSIRSLRDAYQIIFANNLHKTIKLLTSLTIILSIPTMIASIYGMNVDLPLAKSSLAFVVIMVVTFCLSFFALLVFKKRGWL
ncbi:MAG: magnesium transporter CorA family protein [Chlamydiae bacterium]|nr:magnesium transporter CorA family protein [Chlamydiota bacterium]